MDISLVILGALCFTSLVMAGALAVAWASFGRPRHAASWAVAFAITAVQSLLNAIAIAARASDAIFILVFLPLLLPGALIAIGVRQRAGQPSHWRGTLLAIVFAAVVMLGLGASPALLPFGLAWAPACQAAFLYAAAWRLRPQRGALLPAERVLAGALLFTATVLVADAIPTAISGIWSQDLPEMRVYRALLALCVPPAVICGGVGAILVVASDLASDLRRLASRDPLTGLLNRRGFQDAAVRTLANAQRLGVPTTVVLADIDHFKTINDRFGHTAGDHVLCFLAEILTGGVRQGDLVARIGGEEFAMMLVAETPATACAAIERVRVAVERGYEHDGAPVPVTASFGVAAAPALGGDLDAILARALDRADRALYLSKIAGRNRTTLDGVSSSAA